MPRDAPKSGSSPARPTTSRRRAAVLPIVTAGVCGWTIFADDGVARTIDAAGGHSANLVSAAGTRIVNMVDAAVSAGEAAAALASSVAAVAAEIADALSRLANVLG